jgi:hypothetical protein
VNNDSIGGFMGELIKTNDNNIDAPLDDLITCVRRTILEYCPYTHDRTDLAANNNAPEFKISISNSPTKTRILYMNRVFPVDKLSYVDHIMSSVPEREDLNRLITFDEVSKIIDFILEDHKHFEKVEFEEMNSRFQPYQINMNFIIEWPDTEGKKLYCGDMGVELSFADGNMANEFYEQILKKFKPRLTYKYVKKR